MLMSAAIEMVNDCPTDDAIADLLVTFGIVAMPTMASKCGLAEFFNQCEDVYMAEVSGSADLGIAEVWYRTTRLGRFGDREKTDLTAAALSFINKFDMCYYSKLVPQDIVDVYEMFDVKWGASDHSRYIHITGYDAFFHLRVSHVEDREERYEAVRKVDGSFEFTLINVDYF
jgi:hypothetical protein